MARRSRYGVPRTKRTKKIRPLVRIKERVAKKGGRCSACRGRYEAGDRVTVAIIKRRTYHTHTCVPANVAASFSMGGGAVAIANTPTAVVAALSANWTVGEAKLVALQALENAMVAVAKNETVTPEMEKAFERYNKLKAVFLRPGTEHEGKQGAKFSVLEVVKAFF